MIILYVISSFFIAWIWVDYFRLIDIYEKERLKYLILTFFLGALSVLFVLGTHLLFVDDLNFDLTGGVLNDLLFCILQIGVLEELAKLIPFLFIYKFFKKEINEPIDIVAYMAISALGFATSENVLYFSNYGSHIISGRAVLSVVGHMFFASLTAYGIIQSEFKKNRLYALLFFSLAAISHGLYDFFLMHFSFGKLGYLVMLLFYLEGISVFAVIMNNALNNSNFFTYKKVINSSKVSNRLLLYYLIVFAMQFCLVSIESNLNEAFYNLGLSTFLTAFIVFILSLRLSRFKLIKGHWEVLKLELPFGYKVSETESRMGVRYHIVVKGEAYNEVYLNKYFEDFFWLCPLTKRNKLLNSTKLGYIEDKLFLKNKETYYLCKLFWDQSKTRYEYVLLKPKVSFKKFTQSGLPIFAVLRKPDFIDLNNKALKMSDFQFMTWAYPKSYEEWKRK